MLIGESHLYRSTIPPVPEGTPRPLWSVMIPTYNCARYLREALLHVLAQDPGPELMQIEVVDDHSTADDPAAVVAEVGHGRVGFYRQPENVGHTKNFETCLKRSRGTLIHLLHGDDYVRDGFYHQMQRAFEQSQDIGAAFCRQIFMDEQSHWRDLSPLEQMESGILDNWLERLATEQRIMTPSIVVRREIYEKLGGFDSRLICAEDWEMWIRIAANYPIWYEVEPLAVYRMHSASNTGRHVRSGEERRYTRMAIEIFKSYLPHEIAENVARKARETYALSTLSMAHSMFTQRDVPAAIVHIREALKFSCSLRVIWQIVRLFIQTGAGWLRRLAAGYSAVKK
jgi:glycosyltransferase involved in cell wall biosynthesis